MANVIPLGLDQLQGASHIHYNSFFYWWYWTFSLGRIIVTIPQYCSEKIEIGILIQAGISLLCITVALILDALLKHWLVIEPCCNKQGNPITQILRIARCIIKRPSCQHIPSTVRHEIDLSKCSRLDLAKKRYGGKYETEYVEDVRTFLSMLPVLVSIGFLVFSTSVIFGTIHLVQGHMEDDLPQISTYWQSCTFEISTLSAINAILLLALIPVLDLLMVPLLRHAMIHPSILKRLGVGGICTLLGMLSLLTLEGLGDRSFSGGSNTCMFGEDTSQESNGMSGYWLILPMVLVTLAQIMIYIPSFEFISAQAPYNMRGLLIGIFLSLGTLFSLMSGLVQYLFSWKKIKAYPFHPFTGYSCTFWFFVITSSLTAIGVCLYMVIACKYKRRKRDDTFNQVGMIEEYFSSEGFHWD